MSAVNPLSAEFLYELYATALRQEPLCAVLARHMRKEYLPDRSFQQVQEAIAVHFKTYKTPPSYAVLAQTFHEDYDAIELIDTFREYDEGQSAEVMTDMLESYIKGVRLQSVYAEVGKLYNENKQDKAEKTLREYAEWLAGFTLKSSSFVDVAATFKERFERNRRREEEEERSTAPRVSRFYIPYLDALNAGRNLRGQLTCFLASTGVGKSHIAKWIGVRADIDDGLHVLHFQLEGSEEEALNAYSRRTDFQERLLLRAGKDFGYGDETSGKTGRLVCRKHHGAQLPAFQCPGLDTRHQERHFGIQEAQRI